MIEDPQEKEQKREEKRIKRTTQNYLMEELREELLDAPREIKVIVSQNYSLVDVVIRIPVELGDREREKEMKRKIGRFMRRRTLLELIRKGEQELKE